MIEFITNHPILTLSLIYLIIGILLSIALMCVEGTDILLREKYISKHSREHLGTLGCITILLCPLILSILVYDFNHKCNYYKNLNKKRVSNDTLFSSTTY